MFHNRYCRELICSFFFKYLSDKKKLYGNFPKLKNYRPIYGLSLEPKHRVIVLIFSPRKPIFLCVSEDNENIFWELLLTTIIGL